jgi:hypothetical protein
VVHKATKKHKDQIQPASSPLISNDFIRQLQKGTGFRLEKGYFYFFNFFSKAVPRDDASMDKRRVARKWVIFYSIHPC